MQQEQLDKLKVWFTGYVGGFYGGDPYINAHIKLKEDHTHRTCREILFLAEELGLDANQKRIAEATALLHDIGRFKQFLDYRTYNDLKSTDHCLLGVEVLRGASVLESLDNHESLLIETAVKYHGCKELPRNLNGQLLLFSKLVRDADKLDVFYVVTENYRRHKDNPGQFILDLEFPDEHDYSPQIVQAILSEQLIDYGNLRTLNDMKLCQLSWVYDVNFTAALKRIRQERFLEKLLAFLPETPDIDLVRRKILSYVEQKIRREA